MNVKTFPLAGAVYTNSKSLENNKTHAVELDAQDRMLRVLCGKVKLESVIDDTTQATTDIPTCKVCARNIAKLGAV